MKVSISSFARSLFWSSVPPFSNWGVSPYRESFKSRNGGTPSGAAALKRAAKKRSNLKKHGK